MSTPIIEVDAFTGTVVTMEDGDDRDAASVLQATQPLTNRSLFLRNRVKGGAASYRDQPTFIAEALTNFVWTNTWNTSGIGGGNRIAYAQTDTAAPNGFYVPLSMPRADGLAKITEVRVRFHPTVGTHGDVPAVQPTFSLIQQPLNGDAPTVLRTVTFAAGSVGAYEADQLITLGTGGSLPHIILATSMYWARFEGEAGADSEIGLAVFGIDMSIASS
jgi:hypothetical protein